ncbi:MAG: iron-containing alcohol dehydrogenase [Akkermansiaceae bacterium]|nr:iron-containing alcohol dehydrogenase [Akkermansiaceae bacterium]
MILHGGGSRHHLPRLVREFGGTRVLLVTDPGVVRLGVIGEISADLIREGLDVSVFDQVQPDPTDENVASGLAALEDHRADIIIAIGGGSPIDTAKVIAIRPSNPQPLPEFMGLHKIPHPGLPLIAVPTTAGTGSEALVHGMSRPIGAVFHLPHGLSNAILLPAVTAYSLPASSERYATIARTVGCADEGTSDPVAGDELLSWFESLNQDLRIPRLSECPGVTAEVFEAFLPRMAGDALASGSPANNPKVPDAEEIIRLYRQTW